MTNLDKDLKNLESEYRKVFIETAKEIFAQIAVIEESKIPKYLNSRYSKTKKELLVKSANLKKTCKCVNCGICCKFAVSEFSFEELRIKAQNGDNLAKQFIQTFTPYETESQYKKIYPEYLELLRGENYYVYHCPKITKDNKCPDYENRPQICIDFPDNPIAFLAPECGYHKWKTKSEPLYLKLRAEGEIIEHIISNL